MTIDARAWRALKARADAPPDRPRDALWLAETPIGSIEPSLARTMVAAGLPIATAASGWRVASPPGADADGALARIAQWLHREGHGSAWRDELLAVTAIGDITDSTDLAGTPCARIERAAVRPLGILTRAVHLIGRTPDGSVWVQQRAFDKATDPGLWDTLMGGLRSADESWAQTLERETWEEAGLRIADLLDLRSAGHIVIRRPVVDGYLVEHIQISVATVPEGLTPTNLDGEVARFERLDRAAVIERLHADAFTLEAAMILARWLLRAPCAVS